MINRIILRGNHLSNSTYLTQAFCANNVAIYDDT